MSDDDRRRVLDRLSQAVATLPQVSLAYAFGSFVRKEPFRDLDVGLERPVPDPA